MQLIEDGVFTLDDPVSQWLDADLIEKVSNANQVSIRQLLNHTSGIYDVITDNAFYLDILKRMDTRIITTLYLW